MGLLQEVQNEQARAKVGAFGSQGTGKTTTLALLALGVSKTFHNGSPVAMMDTENGSDYLKPIFDAEGVKFLVAKTGAFVDMVKVLQEAEAAGCCAFIMDSVTHTWRELVESYCAVMAAKYRNPAYSPQFQDWKDIKREWAVWTKAFLNSPLHCFIAGRAGYEYEYEVNDKGKKELIKGDTKMKAEGEFGYEPSLLIEMDMERRGTEDGHGGKFTHLATVLKDRARFLNGKTFEFRDMNSYATGDWKRVWEPFAPHFSFLNIGGKQNAINGSTSDELFDELGGEGAGQRAKARKVALEEIEALMGTVLWPGTTNEAKRVKSDVLCVLFGVRSWTAVTDMPLLKIEQALSALQTYDRAAAKPELPSDIVNAMGTLLEAVQKDYASVAQKGAESPAPPAPATPEAVPTSVPKANIPTWDEIAKNDQSAKLEPESRGHQEDDEAAP